MTIFIIITCIILSAAAGATAGFFAASYRFWIEIQNATKEIGEANNQLLLEAENAKASVKALQEGKKLIDQTQKALLEIQKKERMNISNVKTQILNAAKEAAKIAKEEERSKWLKKEAKPCSFCEGRGFQLTPKTKKRKDCDPCQNKGHILVVVKKK